MEYQKDQADTEESEEKIENERVYRTGKKNLTRIINENNYNDLNQKQDNSPLTSKRKKTEMKSEIIVSIQKPSLYLTNQALNSLFLFFQDDPQLLDTKNIIKNRKTLLKCILKYGSIKELVDRKKNKKRYNKIYKYYYLKFLYF